MTILHLVSFALVAVGGTLVVLTRDPRRQAIVASLNGLFLGMLFFTLQAPDVALSQLTIGTVILPLLILLTLTKVRGNAK